MSYREQELYGDSIEKTENGYKVDGVEIDENIAKKYCQKDCTLHRKRKDQR